WTCWHRLREWAACAACCLLQRCKLPGELLHAAAVSRLLIGLSSWATAAATYWVVQGLQRDT
ncbi:hypothetical protein Dimus_023185, partial [Dionaea muscipula]